MSFALRTYGADGALQLNENSFTMRIVLSTLVTFSSGTKTNQDFSVPGCTASNSVAIVIPVGPYVEGTSFQFETEMVDNIARVYNYTRTFAASNSATGTMRLMVIRFA